ncbi:hypothetical protein NQ314_001183 [Rhamnusium bicolor]|uniref:PiggyBac transposable element-derived protein domain-containing protein n=1 Tax=Rhamnusium bicolor TaxID=1586634 RepID=A0AAV8ZSM2_9CUCU|nr:hypothetical protein NQ314_001183 [Rhamnusium bicolor]
MSEDSILFKRSESLPNFKFKLNMGNLGMTNFFKIRPLLDKIRERFLLVPKEEHMTVDEQIIPTKARSSLKQYNPKKPHKWGYKVFILSGISGFSYDFDFYVGIIDPEPDYPDLGASSNVVVKLAKTIPQYLNHKLFFDNWFSSIRMTKDSVANT